MMRTFATAAAGVWLGGMVVIAIVASTTFGVMKTADVSHPNTIAGKVMAKNFERFDRVQLVCGGILGVWQLAELLAGKRCKRDIVRAVLIAVAIALMLVSVLHMTPKIAALQPTLIIGETDTAVKAAFDDFHKTAVRLSQASLLVVLTIVVEMAWPPGKKANP